MRRSTRSTALGVLAALVIPAAWVLAGSTARETTWDYRESIGHLAARIVSVAGAHLDAEELSPALTHARVISGDEAGKLLESWGRTAEPARRALRSEGAVAVLLRARQRSYLYVPGLDLARPDRDARVADAGFLLADFDPPPCYKCIEEGNWNQGCDCTIRCWQVNCPGGGAQSSCTHGCQGSPEWSPKDAWTDPIPCEYQKVREILGGPDARFLCQEPVRGLEPGKSLFASCAGVR